MLLDRPEGPAEARGFVHQRILGGIGGFFTGGVGGAVRGVVQGGGGNPVIPSGVTDFSLTGGGPCPGLFSVRGPDGTCINLGALPPGGRPAVTAQANGAARFDGSQHHPHAPVVVSQAVRRCPRGHVLSWRGDCVSKRDIRNSDRMYPKPPKPLGTRTQLKAVRVASQFGRALKANEKRLKKLGRALAGPRGR